MGFLCLWALVLSVISPGSTVEIGAVTLSADADPAPGGYVVPEGGNVTFTCNYSLSDIHGGVLWDVDLRVPGGRVTNIASQGLAAWLPQMTSPDTTTLANPASLTLNNVTFENNQSFVECFREGFGLSNATIIVEGSPNCPTVHTTVNTTSLAVSIHKSLSIRWLPEWYHVEVSSHSIAIGPKAVVYNSTLKGTTSFEVTSLEPDTVYNITVIPCNKAGCNESCDVHSIQTTQTGNEESADASRKYFGIIFTVIAMMVFTIITIAEVIIVVFICKRLKQNVIGDVVQSPPIELVEVSTLREDQNASVGPLLTGGGAHERRDSNTHADQVLSSNTVPVPIDRSSYQLHDATSAADEASQESGREATNRDATM